VSRDLSRLERELLALSRHPGMGVLTTKAVDADMLERSAYLLLSRLDEDGPLSIKELTDVFRLDTSTVNRHTAALLKAGLVDRIADPDGGIARKFRISEDGARRLAEHRRRVRAGLGRVVADWSQDELAAFTAALAHFNASIDAPRRPSDA